MIRNQNTLRAPHQALVAALALAAVPGIASAAQEGTGRQMVERERTQRENEREQAEAIQRQLAEARRRLEESSREVAALSRDLGRNYTYTIGTLGAPPRALLGIVLAPDSAARGGARVDQVSPGGAAAEAGIRAGDVITTVAGQDLSKETNAATALVEKMRQVEPEQPLQVQVLRDGKKLDIVAVPRRAPATLPVAPGAQAQLDLLRQRYTDNHPEVRSVLEEMIANAPGRSVDRAVSSSPLGGMEFATLSERLGQYFGVKEGVLVVRAGADSPYNLQDGDVILAIDGRSPTNAQHAARILRSYQPGEKVKLRVQRDRKAIELDAAAPGGRAN